MPTYDYGCPRCGAFQALRPIAQRDAEARCPSCGEMTPRILGTGPHVGGVRRTVALADAGTGGYRRLRHAGDCRCCRP